MTPRERINLADALMSRSGRDSLMVLRAAVYGFLAAVDLAVTWHDELKGADPPE